MTKTLFIGLGRMGRPMVRHIAESFPTLAYDISRESVNLAVKDTQARGIHDLTDVEDVEVVILMLPTSDHVEETLLGEGLLQKLREGSMVIDMGSSVPLSTQRLAELAGAQGIAYVDAPVSGGVSKADSGELTLLVGGDRTAIERSRPYLQAVGSTVVIVGGSGTGHAAKAINNLVSATNIAVASEAVLRGQAAGIAPERMIEVLNSSTGMSQASKVKFTKHILPGGYASNFAYDLMLKDMSIAMQIDVAEPASKLTRASFEILNAGRDLLGENPDHTEIARVYEQLAGQSIRE